MGIASAQKFWFRKTATAFLALAAGPLFLSAAVPDFKKDVEPIFSEHCYQCHGPEKQKSGLRLDLKSKAFQGGDSGVAFVPGKSRESLLIKLVIGTDPDKIMPPKGRRLSEGEIILLRNWIDSGAAWPEGSFIAQSPNSQKHWAFVPPARPLLPKVRNSRWVQNPIDAFILSALERQNIAPSPEADRPSLIRRLYLDLLGLLPSPEEVRAFVIDPGTDAYERLVDKLLASPHFGERWARHWLDLARYADTSGYQVDRFRPYAYVFRNWVVEAVNKDMPFDEFTIEQLAGDLLPNATPAQKTAAGFHRNTLMNHEDGVDAEEFRCKAKVDRVATTGTVWLGLTLGCAECHTHKYDPIPQREFYQMYAFFNQAEEKDVPAVQENELERYTVQKKFLEEELAHAKTILASYKPQVASNQLAWEARVEMPATSWSVLTPLKVSSTSGTKLNLEKDASIRAVGKVRPFDEYIIETSSTINGISGFRLELLPVTGKAARNKQSGGLLAEFSVKVVEANGRSRRIVLQNPTADYSKKENPVAAAIDGDLSNGWSVGSQWDQRHVAVFESREKVDIRSGAKIVITVAQRTSTQSAPARLRISATASSPPFSADLLPDSILAALNAPVKSRTAKQRDELAKYYREEVDPVSRKLEREIQKLAERMPSFQAAQAQTFLESTNTKPTFVHVRGDFLRHGECVQPGTVSALHPFKPRSSRPDRLDLARWIVDPANPLTSRVTVNRLWQHLFGRGLVETAGDFGVRGQAPSHPELLDWLATEFPRQGWSRKAMLRLILKSATYRQSANSRPELSDRDPLNVFLARQNRFRLEAEIVRDIFLGAAGKLNAEIGGPSIRPYVPETFKVLGSAGGFAWADTEGMEKYKRGLYVITQRTVPYPVSMTFDSANSSESCPRRECSNTPLQALTLLNNSIFVEAAQNLGNRIFKLPAKSTRERIEHGFELCLARKPASPELNRLTRLYEDMFRLTRQNPAAAERILGELDADRAETSELAAYMAVAQVLLNLEEFVTRE